uniref:Uncharacterized protein n=1 Tax=Rhizophora mucronata TaxID=61149 RepID=A0A2P2LH44_RHIMU
MEIIAVFPWRTQALKYCCDVVVLWSVLRLKLGLAQHHVKKGPSLSALL